MTRLNIWNRVLHLAEVHEAMTSCTELAGNIASWPDFHKGIYGRVKVVQLTFLFNGSILQFSWTLVPTKYFWKKIQDWLLISCRWPTWHLVRVALTWRLLHMDLFPFHHRSCSISQIITSKKRNNEITSKFQITIKLINYIQEKASLWLGFHKFSSNCQLYVWGRICDFRRW